MSWLAPLQPQEITAIMLSLKVAWWSTLFSLPFGIAVSWLLAKRFLRWHGLLNILVHLPLIMPPVVTGYVLLLLFGRQGFIGSFLYDVFGFTLAFHWAGAVLAAAVMSFPLMVRSIRLSIEAIDSKLEEAAATLGASNWRIFFTVTLPMSLPGVLAGCVIAFAKAMGEFGATITFVSNIPGKTQTMPTAIYSYLQIPGNEAPVYRLLIVAIVVSAVALIIAEILARRTSR